jgi:hypothetical protein
LAIQQEGMDDNISVFRVHNKLPLCIVLCQEQLGTPFNNNSPAHPIKVEDNISNIKVFFLPTNTTLILQPMDQDVIATFKS